MMQIYIFLYANKQLFNNRVYFSIIDQKEKNKVYNLNPNRPLQ